MSSQTQNWRDGLSHWPVPFVGVPLDASRSALVTIDVQRYWTDRDGPVAKLLRESYPDMFNYFYERLEAVVIPNLARLTRAYRDRNLVVVTVISGQVRADGRDLAPHLQRRIESGGKTSADFHLLRVGGEWHQHAEGLVPAPNEIVLNKVTRSAFTSTSLDQLLRHLGVEQLVIGGLATNGCVDLTARDAADLGYETFLVEDACATFLEDAHAAALLNFARLFGTVLETDEALSEPRGSRKSGPSSNR